ncbi:CU044_5270 family protein [uncultured Jatrophihabitans sp.]|uniref:CU044_5270 family protein n=1 Tax=uncultured Jatrophihabitans sp. TaxID=1610747 RepID=UPI0035CB536E
MTNDPRDLASRLTDALDSAAATLPDAEPPAFSWQQPAARRSSRRRRGLYAASGLAAAAVAATVVAATLPSGHHAGDGHQAPDAERPGSVAPSSSAAVSHARPVPVPHTGQSASALLLAASHTRLRTGDPALRDGQFRYVRIVSPAPGTIVYDKNGTPHTEKAPAGSYNLDQYWIPKDVTDVWMRRSGVVGDVAPDVWTGRCDDLYAHTQDAPKGPSCTRPGSFSDPTPRFVAHLPRDPDALYSQLRSYAESRLNPDKIHDTNYLMFFVIDSLLDNEVVTGDLTSTLYAVLGRIPGIQVLDGVQNYSGVAGTGFRLSTTLGHGPDALRSTATIIVDLASGTFLGDQQVSDGNTYSSAVTTGVADRIGVAGH